MNISSFLIPSIECLFRWMWSRQTPSRWLNIKITDRGCFFRSDLPLLFIAFLHSRGFILCLHDKTPRFSDHHRVWLIRWIEMKYFLHFRIQRSSNIQLFDLIDQSVRQQHHYQSLVDLILFIHIFFYLLLLCVLFFLVFISINFVKLFYRYFFFYCLTFASFFFFVFLFIYWNS